MKHFGKKQVFNSVLIIVFGIIFSLFNFVQAQTFQEPTQAFPGGTPYPPVDTSAANQTKRGSLILDPGSLVFGGSARAVIQLQPGQAISGGANSINLGVGSTPSISLSAPAGALNVNALGLTLPNVLTANAFQSRGTIIFDTASNQIRLYDGTSWVPISGGGGGGPVVSVSSTGWIFSLPNLYTTSSVSNVGIGTNFPPTTLSVLGNVTVMRPPGTTAAPGHAVAFEAWSATAVSTQASDWCRPGVDVGCQGSQTMPDTCPIGGAQTVAADRTQIYTCQPNFAGRTCIDIAQLGGSGPFYRADVTCVAGTENYSMRLNQKGGSSALEFLNNQKVPQLTLDQAGVLGFGNGSFINQNSSGLTIGGPTDTLLSLDRGAGNRAAFRVGTNGYAVFQNKGVDALTISDTGNVGVGTSPATNIKLDVNGKIKLANFQMSSQLPGGVTTPYDVLTVMDNIGHAIWRSPEWTNVPGGIIARGSVGIYVSPSAPPTPFPSSYPLHLFDQAGGDLLALESPGNYSQARFFSQNRNQNGSIGFVDPGVFEVYSRRSPLSIMTGSGSNNDINLFAGGGQTAGTSGAIILTTAEGVKIDTKSGFGQPTCNAAHRGMLWFAYGPAGAHADGGLAICGDFPGVGGIGGALPGYRWNSL